MPVARGLFALRYVATSVTGESPRVVVSADPDCAAHVRLVFGPGATEGLLRRPGDLCVISAERDATLLLTTLGEGADRPEAVTLQIDRLDGEGGAPAKSAPALAAPQAISPPSISAASIAPIARAEADSRLIPLRIAGHVERRGDLFAGPGEWLGDPNGSFRIEGFSVQWPRRPAEVDISYGCALLGLGRMPDGVVGEFVGTRMQARAINGVAFRLIGEQAEGFALIVEAVFSDGTRFGPALAPVDLRGPTGREFLVALRLQLSEVGAKPQRPPASPQIVAAPQQETARRKPARIFRAPRSVASA